MPKILESSEPRNVPQNHYDLPDAPYTEFWLMAQGETDYVVGAFNVGDKIHGDMLVIATEEGVIYVTKEQAMQYFNLKENKIMSDLGKLLYDAYSESLNDHGIYIDSWNSLDAKEEDIWNNAAHKFLSKMENKDHESR